MKTGNSVSVTGFRKEKTNTLKKKSQSHSALRYKEKISRSIKLYLENMEGNPRCRVEKLEDQMDRMLRVSESLNKKIASATSSINKTKENIINHKESRNQSNMQELRVKWMLPNHRPSCLLQGTNLSQGNFENIYGGSATLLGSSRNFEDKIQKAKQNKNASKYSLLHCNDSKEEFKKEKNTIIDSNQTNIDVSDNATTNYQESNVTETFKDLETPETYHLKNLVYHQSMQCEIEKLKLALIQKDEELREQLEKKEKEIEEKFEAQINDLVNKQRKLLEEKEANIVKDSVIQNEGKILGQDIIEAKESLQKIKEEIEILKQEFRPTEDYENINLPAKFDGSEIARKFEEVKASYDDRIRLLDQEFTTRKLIMANEIEKLKTTLAFKEAEFREKLDMKENVLKEKYMRQIDILTKEHRRILQDYENVSVQLESFRTREDTLKAKSDEAFENLNNIKAEHDTLKLELSNYKKNAEDMAALNTELRDKCEQLDEIKNSYEEKINIMQKNYESDKISWDDEIQKLKCDLMKTKLEVRDSESNKKKGNKKEEKNTSHVTCNTNFNLFHDEEYPSLEENTNEKDAKNLISKLKNTEEKYAKMKEENVSLKSELQCGKKIMQEMTTNIFERQQKIKMFEEKNSQYETRMSVLQHEFEARKVMMLKEIERLNMFLTSKDAEFKARFENVEKHVKEMFQKHIESLSEDKRDLLNSKGKLSAEISFLKEQKEMYTQYIREAEEKLIKIRVEQDILQEKNSCAKIDSVSLSKDEGSTSKLHDLKASYEDRISFIQQDFEQRRVVMANEIDKLRRNLSSKDDEIRMQVEAKEHEVKAYYTKLVECLSDELKKTLTVAKRNEDVIHEKWNLKLNECREQMKKNMLSLEKQIDVLTNNASSRTVQLVKERDELRSKTSILESDVEQIKRQHEVALLEKDKKLDRVTEEHERTIEELEQMKECLNQKEDMIEMLQETVRKECTEREDILRKLDEIQKMSGKTYKMNIAKRNTSSDSSMKKYQPPPIKQHSRQLSTHEPSLSAIKNRMPGYMKGVPLLLPTASYVPLNKSSVPRRFPSSPKTCGSSKDLVPKKTPKCVNSNGGGSSSPEMKFTVGKALAKTRKSNRLTRSKSLQASRTIDASNHSEDDLSTIK